MDIPGRSGIRHFARRLLGGALILGAASLFVLIPTASSEPSRTRAQSAAEDRIVYSARLCDAGSQGYGSEDCTFEIYSVALDGSEPQQVLSTFGTDDVYPTFSPDGTEIAFNSWDKVWGCDSHLWLMEADGSSPRMISSPNNAWDETFGWSPSGQIAFTRWPNGPTCEYGFHSDVQLLTREGEVWSETPLLTRNGSESKPAFSPSGRRVAYEYDPDNDGSYSEGEAGQKDLWIARADGTGHRRLTRTKRLSEGSPAWSPNGKLIAFDRGTAAGDFWQPEGRASIWLMRADGSDKRRITRGSIDMDPAWSPDGTRIAFTRCQPYRDCAIAILEVAHPERVEIVVHIKGYMAWQPSWQPAS